MKLWLDDERPAPPGWVHVTTVADAQRLLASGKVTEASLDHDLGPQPVCFECERDGETKSSPCQHCSCHHRDLDGYDLVKWMVGSGTWSVTKPQVHSANPTGAANMEAAIERYFPASSQTPTTNASAPPQAAGLPQNSEGNGGGDPVPTTVVPPRS